MTNTQRTLFAVALILGVAYLLLLPFKPYPYSWLLKPLPMLIYAVLLFKAFPGWIGRFLAIGLIGAAAGDFYLDYGDRDGLFRQALLSFLVNQIAFTVAFVLLAGKGVWHWPRAIPAVLYGIILAIWILPLAGNLQLAVAVYMLCLITMAVMAARVEPKLGCIWVGSLFFVVADSLIGINKFAEPFPYAVLVIVTCYFGGQSLIAWGLLRRALQDNKHN